jgi:hypothetical protein
VPIAASMEIVTVECLGCGDTRRVIASGHVHLEAGECHRCGYVGWARTAELNEPTRRALRDRPLVRRRVRAAS